MYAVYFCGPTDCFLQAIFQEKDKAIDWANKEHPPEGFYIKFWKDRFDVDRSDTGWENF